MNRSIVQEKSYLFAIEAIQIYVHLTKEKKEFILSKQFIRSATSIGANIEEALGGQSSKDFSAKISIAYKEARETHYWVRLLSDSDLISKHAYNKLHPLLNELLQM